MVEIDIENKMETDKETETDWKDLGIEEVKVVKAEPNQVIIVDEAQQALDKIARLKEMKRIRAERYYYSKGKAHRKEYYQKNKVRINEQAKKYKQSPGAKERRQAYMKEYMKRYYIENQEYFLKYHEKRSGDKKENENDKGNENEHNKE